MDFEFLEEKRKEQRYTVTLFCSELGIDNSTYYRWKDDPGRITVTKANQIAELLKLTAREKAKMFA